MEIRVGKKGLFAKVDDEDFSLVSAFTWSPRRWHKSIYAQSRLLINGRWIFVSMHRLILGSFCPPLVDHTNGDGLDNQRRNLRAATVSQNVANHVGRKNARPFRGVYLTRNGTYFAQIGIGRAKQYLGTHPTQEQAARAYDAAALRLFGAFARLNFPEVK